MLAADRGTELRAGSAAGRLAGLFSGDVALGHLIPNSPG
jgi:hypothetical protein